MNAARLIVAALLCWPAVAQADDAEVQLTLDGRPVDRDGGVAVLRHGVIFADAIDLTKCFDGFISLRRGGSATITIGANTAAFTPGSRQARTSAGIVKLPGTPFLRNGDLFIPLDAFVTYVARVTLRADAARHRADIRVTLGQL